MRVAVSSLMAEMANSSSKLSVASKASHCQGICWWSMCLALRSVRFLSASQILFSSMRAAPLLTRPRHFDPSCTVCS